jgi:ComF family protein
MQSFLRGAVHALAELVGPTRCAGCDGETPRRTAFCPACVVTLVRAPTPDPDRTAAFLYGGAIAQAIRRLKFDDRPDLARPLLAGLGIHLSRFRDATLVVPVPLHPSRLVERGYNQAALLARPLAGILGIPFAARALARTMATARQTDLTRDARRANVLHAFTANEPSRLEGESVLLVDDVETTGATLAACRAALLSGGAEAVHTVVMARADGADRGG